MYLSGLALFSLAGFAIVTLMAAARDIRTKPIPQGLILTLLGGFLLLAAGSGWSREEIAASLIAATMVLFVGLLLSAMGWAEVNHGKLAAVFTLWLGAHQTLDFVLLSGLIGLFVALLLACLPRLGWRAALKTGSRWFADQRGLPVGATLAAAAITLIPYSPWVTSVG